MKIQSWSVAIWFQSLFILGLLSSCTNPGPSSHSSSSTSKFSIIFSHNINGETHPCGCRHFPLGGLPQVAGLIHDIRKQGPTLYIDTGDALFSLPTLPPALLMSSKFTAQKIVQALTDLKLDLFLPGDQDFAAGEKFLAEISHKVPFTFLVSNLSPESKIKHKTWFRLNLGGPRRIYFIGILHPETLGPENSKYVLSPKKVLPEILQKLKEDGYQQENSQHKIILLSHSGMGKDEELAKDFPHVHWILGAHTQDFLRTPNKVGPTNIVQVLSRNHYLGQVFPFWPEDQEGAYKLWEVRDELQTNLKPNPFISFIDRHKTELSAIQKKEQEDLGMESFPGDKKHKFPPPQSCIECHQDQANKWQKTTHALAYWTLIKNKEENNLQCIGCHSVKFQDSQGFKKAEEIVVLQQSKKRKDYWSSLRKELESLHAVRGFPKEKLEKFSQKWIQLDQKFAVQHNFANVQCLNCHQMDIKHPFSSSTAKVQPEKKLEQMKETCLKCHTADQSPEWYLGRGLAQKVDEQKLAKMIKAEGCPPLKD